jgi:hypothetical protein
VAVKGDCRHYVMQTVRSGERTERCRIAANQPLPFACPEGCLFYEPRTTSSAGWQVGSKERPGASGAGPQPS